MEKTGKIDYRNADFLLKEGYDTFSGLYDHTQPDPHPFGGYLIREGANGYADGPLRDLINEFHDDGIGELFHLSLAEFLDLPIPYLEIIRDKKDQLKERRLKEIKDLETLGNESRKK